MAPHRLCCVVASSEVVLGVPDCINQTENPRRWSRIGVTEGAELTGGERGGGGNGGVGDVLTGF